MPELLEQHPRAVARDRPGRFELRSMLRVLAFRLGAAAAVAQASIDAAAQQAAGGLPNLCGRPALASPCRADYRVARGLRRTRRVVRTRCAPRDIRSSLARRHLACGYRAVPRVPT